MARLLLVGWLVALLAGVTGAQFVNGDFDGGANGWIESSSNDFQVIVNSFGEGVSAHSRPNAAWLGGADDETASVAQAVTVTAATPALRYWEWIDSTESACQWDVARIYAGDAQVAMTGLCAADNTGGWVKRTVDLSAFTDQTVAVRFEVNTDATLLSSQYVDDVALEASALGPLSVMAGKVGNAVRLTWGHGAPYASYEVWRSASAYFLPGASGSEKRGDVPAPAGNTASFDDGGATGNAAGNFFYLVRGSGAGTTRVSNRTGEFDFALAGGG